MLHLKCSPKTPKLAQLGWTLLVLLAALIATEIAEAQALSPRIAPQTRPSTASSASAPTTASAANPSGIENLAIDTTKCTTDIETTKKLVKQEIMKSIREAQAAGYQPSISYEKSPSNSMQARVEARGSSQADRLTNSLFAAIQNPKDAANAASEKLAGSANRRASIEMYARCEGDDPVPRKILENKIYLGSQRSACASVGDMGINSSQIYQTDMPANKVVVRFARAKMTSTAKNTVTFCAYDRRSCASPDNYQAYDFSNFTPTLGREYFIEDTTDFGMLASAYMRGKMVNRSAMKISPINICGSRVYMVTAFQNGGGLGFDRSSLIGLVAPINGKTIVLGDLSAQGYTKGTYPLEFPKKWDDTRNAVLGEVDPQTRQASGGYYAIANLVGSTERTFMGEVISTGASSRPAVTTAQRGVAQ
jgi:hypothetical protein